MQPIKAMRYKLVFLMVLLQPLYLFAQLQSPEAALEKYNKYPSERIFVQFDKAAYLAGETLHFKAWVFAQSSLSYISTNLYVEWLDEQKKPLYRSTVPLVGGVGDGAFIIAKDLAENIYYFRAYTTWLLNFNEAQQFIQPVAVYNPSSKLRLAAPPAVWGASARPESGVLLNGVESDVAVRLHSFARLQQQWSGYVFENADSTNKLSEFQSLNEEIGLVTFTPVYGKKYSIKITGTNDSSTVLALPAVQQQGAALKTVSLAEGIGFRINSKGLPQQLKGYKIVAHLQGNLLYSASIQNAKEEINGLIPVDATAKGLVHITLFDAAGNAVAERLCFANLQNAFFQTATVAYSRFTGEAKKINEWKITIDSLRAHTYSVQVTDALSTDAANNNVLASYWLNGLSLQPQKTGLYFNKENKTAGTALDALLISEQWNLFDWKQLTNTATAAMQYFPDNYLSYQGAVTLKGKAVGKEKITLLFQLKDSSRILTEVITDSAGFFRLKSLYFFDTAKVFFHLSNNKNAAVKIDVDLRRSETFTSYAAALPQHGFTLLQRNKNDSLPLQIKNDLAAIAFAKTIADGYKTMEAVQVKSIQRSKADQLNKRLSSPMFQSPGEVVFDFINEEQDLGGSGILEWLGGRVAGAIPDGSGEISIRGQRPSVYVDEFLDDGNPTKLSMIPWTEIAMVKVIRNSYLIGAGGTAVIAVYTKKGDMFPPSEMKKPNITAKTVFGYEVTNTFKPFSYGNSMTSKTGYDTRNVLYFNTAITPQRDKALIKFYNNDISKKLHLLVIGFTSSGQLVYLSKDIPLQ
jgi:hypothetical protein